MAKLNLKTVNKKTKDQLITFVLVIAVYIVVQIMVAAGAISSLMQGLLCLLYTSPSPRDRSLSRMPSSA